MRLSTGRSTRTQSALLAGLLLFLTFSASAQRKQVIGYFPSWNWRMEKNLMTVDKVPYDKLTIINYAFFYPLPDGTIRGRDSVGDALYLGAAPGTRLTDVAHNHGVKVMLSLGGWEESDNFPAMAADPATRRMFAHSCVDVIRQYGFDGIDIDWEYPGFAEHKGTPADKENFTLLLKALRDSLKAHGAKTGQDYLLTAAFPASANQSAYMDMPAINELLDQFNLMTYDFHGAWDPRSNHNSPLYPSNGADSARCVDAAFVLYNKTYGIPASKINLGLPFYGRTFAGCTTINSPHAGSDTTHFGLWGAYYAEIVRLKENFTRRWDEAARVPYLVSKEWNLLVSYDDEESIRLKAEYIVDKGASGCIIWEITGDFLPDGTNPLLNTVAKTFASATPTIH